MGFLRLNLHGHPEGAILDPDTVVGELKARFPEIVEAPGDPLAASVQRVEELTEGERRAKPDGPHQQVLESVRRKAAAYGPARAFQLPVPGRAPIRGTVRRYDLTFLFDEELSPETYQRLVEFLKSFGVGQIRASTADGRRTEVLADMGGKSQESENSPRWPPTDPSASKPAETP